jgi:hypothetical protein
MGLRLLRESPWTRLYETEVGDYFDSKFRTGECEASGADWARAWVAADEDGRIELEAAFVFMQDEGEVRAALEGVGAVDAGKRRELGSRWIGPEDALPERHRRFLDAYREALEGGDPDLPRRRETVLEATWFRVTRTLLGVEIEPKIGPDALVSAREFHAERDGQPQAATRHLYDVWWEVRGGARGRATGA